MHHVIYMSSVYPVATILIIQGHIYIAWYVANDCLGWLRGAGISDVDPYCAEWCFFTNISNICFALLPPVRNGVCFMQVLAVWYDRPALPAGVAGKRRSTITVITHQRDFSQTSGRSNATVSCAYPRHVAYLVVSKNKSQTGGMESQ